MRRSCCRWTRSTRRITREGRSVAAAARCAPSSRSSISIRHGETLGLVGESGSGKSTLARCIVRLTDAESGSVVVRDVDLMKLSRRQLRSHRRYIQMVFQDPFGSLDPRCSVGKLIAEGPIVHGVPRSRGVRPRAFAARARRTRPPRRGALSARIFGRPAPAHRHRARVGARARRFSSPTSRCQRSTCRFRRRCCGCSPISATASISRCCSSRMTCASRRRCATASR